MPNKAIREEFNNELKSLLHEIEVMGKTVAKSVREATEALLTGNTVLAQKVINGDDTIDLMQTVIEDKCILLIALQQPLARDLRILTTALKIVTDLERIGDYADNIARLSLKKMQGYDVSSKYGDFKPMAQEVAFMIENVIEAYINVDICSAEEIHKHDDVVDAYCKKMHDEILLNIQATADNVDRLTGILAILHYLERAGDHVTNIAEWVIFLSTGRRYKV